MSKIIFHGNRYIALFFILSRLFLPILGAPLPYAIIGNYHVCCRRVRIARIQHIIHHAGVAAAVAKGQHRPLSDLPFNPNGLVCVQILLDEATREYEVISVRVLVIHVGGHVLVSFQLHFKLRPDHVIRSDIISDGRIGHNGSRCRALRTAYDIDGVIVLVKELYHLHHGKVETVNITHVLKTISMFLSEFHGIIVELLHRHSGVGFGKIPCKLLARNIARL